MTSLFDYMDEPPQPPRPPTATPCGIPIDHDIPVGADRSHIVRSTWNPGALPFDLMAVGDSFAVRPPAALDPIRAQNRVSGAASKLHRETRKRFTTRQQRDGSVRCWRIA